MIFHFSEKKKNNNFQGVKLQLLSMGIQLTILYPARMKPKLDNKKYKNKQSNKQNLYIAYLFFYYKWNVTVHQQL